MKRITYTLLFGMLLQVLLVNGQSTITLSFTCINNMDHIEADSFKVVNLTKNCDTTITYPDSVLILEESIGIEELYLTALELSTTYPNPFSNITSFNANLPSSGMIYIEIINNKGQKVASFSKNLQGGIHTFDFLSAKKGIYLINVNFDGHKRCIKAIAMNNNSGNYYIQHKSINYSEFSFKSAKSENEFLFNLGDKLAILAYSYIGESGSLDTPTSDTDYEIQFATNIPCPGIDSIEYEGQYYHTIQIFNQCWFKNNLNVGVQISSSIAQTDNDTIEKYCLVNDSVQCVRYGGIYTWDEMMNYIDEDGSQGICPTGWHIASDDDFKVLEGAVDSYNEIGSSVWDQYSDNGSDVGYKLKSNGGWYNGGNGSDEYGFGALWGGYLYQGNWAGGDLFGTFFTSTTYTNDSNKAVQRGVSWMMNGIIRDKDSKTNARPVRCIKN